MVSIHQSPNISFKLKALPTDNTDHKFILAAKILAPKVLNKQGVMNIINSVWKTSQKFKQVRVSKNLYSFAFDSEEYMLKILERSPWSIMNYSVVLKKWDKSLYVDELMFNDIDLWVRVSGLPRCMFTTNNEEMIGNMLGSVIKVDIRDSLFSI